jgi:XTP/dITP diphosphohydrolase
VKLIVASRNAGKLAEYKRMFEGLDFSLISMDQAGISPDLDLPEEGDSFEANAKSKAEDLQKLVSGWTLADDSGLVVDALGGAPGVYSARYAGVAGNGPKRDLANLEKLLKNLADIDDRDRTARFVCVIHLLGPEGQEIVSRGVCEGRIIRNKRGSGGFGYDPIFMPEGYTQTMAELSMDEKNKISHRGRALAQLVEQIKKLGKN